MKVAHIQLYTHLSAGEMFIQIHLGVYLGFTTR